METSEEQEERYAYWRGRFEIPILVAALAVVPVILLEQADTPGWVQAATVAANWAIWIVFSAELVVLTRFTPRGEHLRRHWLDVFIVVTSLPVWGAVLAGTRLLRLLRLVRVLRLIAVASRGGVAIRRIFKKGGVGYLLTGTLLLAMVFGGLFALFESSADSILDGIWWAIVTLTTVGYGDIYPETMAGRGAAVVLMIAGISFVAVLTGSIAAYLTGEDKSEEESELAEVIQRLERIERQIETMRPPEPQDDEARETVSLDESA